MMCFPFTEASFACRRFSPLLSCYLVIHSLNEFAFWCSKGQTQVCNVNKILTATLVHPPQNVFKKNIKLVSTWLSELSLLFGRQIIKVRLSLISIFTRSNTKPGSCFSWQIIPFLRCLSVCQWNRCLSDASLAAMYASALWNMSAREIKGCSWRRPSVELPGVEGGGLWFIMKTLLGGHCGNNAGENLHN